MFNSKIFWFMSLLIFASGCSIGFDETEGTRLTPESEGPHLIDLGSDQKDLRVATSASYRIDTASDYQIESAESSAPGIVEITSIDEDENGAFLDLKCIADGSSTIDISGQYAARPNESATAQADITCVEPVLKFEPAMEPEFLSESAFYTADGSYRVMIDLVDANGESLRGSDFSLFEAPNSLDNVEFDVVNVGVNKVRRELRLNLVDPTRAGRISQGAVARDLTPVDHAAIDEHAFVSMCGEVTRDGETYRCEEKDIHFLSLKGFENGELVQGTRYDAFRTLTPTTCKSGDPGEGIAILGELQSGTCEIEYSPRGSNRVETLSFVVEVP